MANGRNERASAATTAPLVNAAPMRTAVLLAAVLLAALLQPAPAPEAFTPVEGPAKRIPETLAELALKMASGSKKPKDVMALTSAKLNALYTTAKLNSLQRKKFARLIKASQLAKTHSDGLDAATAVAKKAGVTIPELLDLTKAERDALITEVGLTTATYSANVDKAVAAVAAAHTAGNDVTEIYNAYKEL